MVAAPDSGSHDPRRIDPAHVAENEDDLAHTQGSSDPEVDAEEAREAVRRERAGDRLDTEAALAAMPAGNAEVQDQVTQREPDTAHTESGDHVHDSGHSPGESKE